jgi:uncharacterized protein (DUF58 family)
MTTDIENAKNAMEAAAVFARILRRHADEADKAASSDQPQKWVTGHRGWVTLRDQLREAAGVLEGITFLLPVAETYARHLSDKAEVVGGCECAICKLHRKPQS